MSYRYRLSQFFHALYNGTCILAALLFACVVMMLAVTTCGGPVMPEAMGADLRIPIGNTPAWQTEVSLALPLTAPAPVPYSLSFCGYGPSGVAGTIVPGGGAILPRFGETVCAPAFGTLPVFPGLTTSAKLLFSDGKTRTSYVIPPLGAVSQKNPQRLGLVRNTDDVMTSIVVLNDAAADFYVDIYDGQNVLVGREAFSSPGPVTQYNLKTKISVGTIVLTEGDPAWYGLIPDVPATCFVAVASPLGDNANVIPCK